MNYVILCWMYGTHPDIHQPAAILGPFGSKEEAQQVVDYLTCETYIRPITMEAPEWASM